jgi:hypothetical protein
MDYPFNLLNYTDQRLLELTDNFTLDDWLNVRDQDYWIERDTMRNAKEANAFLLTKVEEYLGNNSTNAFDFPEF